jgi:recombinase
VYGVRVSRRRRARRRSGKERRDAPELARPPREVIREADYVERLAYTRTQAAEALGVSRSTFIRRVLPYVETIEMAWGARLIPADELERLVVENRRAAQATAQPAAPGRPPLVSADVVERICDAHAGGASLRRIAADLNADEVPTAHGGRRWWPSTVRSVLDRAGPSGGSRVDVGERRVA